MRDSKSNAAAAELERYFDTDSYAHAANVAATIAKTSLSTTAPLVFVRPSRSGPNHRVTVDAERLVPIGCTFAAGQHDRPCWAGLDVAAGPELVNLARQHWAAACGMAELQRARQDAQAASYLPDPDRPVPYERTDLGRRWLVLEALSGPWPTVAEVLASPSAWRVGHSSHQVKS